MLADRINAAARRVPNWALYILCPLPALWLLWQGLTGGLGVEPIKALEHELGELALQLLIAGLCITPLRKLAGVNLLKFRRAVGLIAFLYVALHLLVWLALDVQIPAQIWADIVKRPYITVGMLGFALLIPLALTSNNLSLRRLGGRRWRQLHRLTYGAVLLGALHYMMLAKGFQIEPLVYLTVVLGLLALRLPGIAVARRSGQRG
ncbi:protein-methionine-sulfoxide reductase heme-binding subunit MsrQ [Salipiger sp. P9]|uniref:protein-methionine-sulfoxide reductase heme-binding subunit MsrQ n=1 Tax=Salipiger pentaromativorans TaxID=2943193 RepID=UPI002157503B|nr:protein-methionine-sulfoxide reductase heme-binding subunit MsrQ [Salipiger pentaromativorans]MCR8549149.1 protein-methionine-sulfoxide reductase heme-binding subunit MsrQ [Salipiger pentaromativorans]